MQNEIPLPYYLQKHENTKTNLTSFFQIPKATESLQLTQNPYLMGGSSISSDKPLMVFRVRGPEYSVEDNLNAITANLIFSIRPEPENTQLHQIWIHRRTALIQTTLDGAAQKWFSVLPTEINSDWKRLRQDFPNCRTLKEITTSKSSMQQNRRLPNETIKQLTERIETRNVSKKSIFL